jgi:hypothetical protein
MSEKIYARLLRLYPSRFRKQYEDEALQLIRDRLRDETGFFKTARLWWDLVADVLAGLPSAYRNSYAVTEAASLSLNAARIPSFKVLDKEPLGVGSILVGGSLSLIALAAFAFLLSRQIAYQPVSGPKNRISPIESVMQRLNSAPTPDSAASNLQGTATPASAQMSQTQAQPSTQARMPAPDLKSPPSGPANRTHRAKCRSRLLPSGKASRAHPPLCPTSLWIMVTHTHLFPTPAAASPLIFRCGSTSSSHTGFPSRLSRPTPCLLICRSGPLQITSRFMRRQKATQRKTRCG